MIGRLEYAHTYKAAHQNLSNRLFSSSAPDFTPDESDALIRDAVRRAEAHGIRKQRVVLDENARITEVYGRGTDKDILFCARYYPPEGNRVLIRPARVEISVTRRRWPMEHQDQFYTYARKVV